MKELIPVILTPTIRHGMTALGAILIKAGLLDAAQAANFTTISVGIVVGGIGLAWSFAKNAKAAK